LFSDNPVKRQTVNTDTQMKNITNVFYKAKNVHVFICVLGTRPHCWRRYTKLSSRSQIPSTFMHFTPSDAELPNLVR